MVVTPSAVPGTANYGGNFLAVMNYGGTAFGGPGNTYTWRYVSGRNEIWRYLSGVNEILEYYVPKTQT